MLCRFLLFRGHFYPRSPCGERRLPVSADPGRSAISIHALLAESDQPDRSAANGVSTFLSTLSLRRATAGSHLQAVSLPDFYPRSPCGERPLRESNCFPVICISIHALLAESDARECARGPRRAISIHALLAESDRARVRARAAEGHFYPRSPCGERQAGSYKILPRPEFLSTLSLRRATGLKCCFIIVTRFLSTLSLRRATHPNTTQTISKHNFYPRSPCGERQ